MTNFDKIKLITAHLKFMIDEGILDEEGCGNVVEEIYSTMEILADCNEDYKAAFEDDMRTLKRAVTEGGAH